MVNFAVNELYVVLCEVRVEYVPSKNFETNWISVFRRNARVDFIPNPYSTREILIKLCFRSSMKIFFNSVLSC